MDTNSPAEGTLMGSHDFREVTFTDADMRSAYQEVSERAEREDGASAYSGTIATTNGVYQSPLHPIPVREDRIDEDGIQSELDGMDTWGPCAAIPILRVTSSQEEWLGKFASEVTVPSELVNGDRDALISALEKAALKAVAKSIRVSGALTVRGWDKNSKRVKVGADPKPFTVRYSEHSIVQTPKATTVATKGKTETRYFVMVEGETRMPAWENGHISQAEARASLPQELPVDNYRRATTPVARYEIISMTRRVTGEPLVTHELSAVGAKTVKVNVTVVVWKTVTPAKVTDEKGWMFYGWAAS